MTGALIAGCLWALAATVTAMLPYRMQFPPGIALLTAAPVLLVWIGLAHGVWIAAVCLLAVLSLFRNPLIYFAKKARRK